MRDWFATLAVGLVIVVGCAAGLGGLLAFLLAFGIAWYLLAARNLGFAQARDMLGIRLLPPIWRRGNWLWIETLLEDGERLIKAATLALTITALALMFWPDIVYGAALLIALFYVSEILRGNLGPKPRLVRIPDAHRAAEPAPPLIGAAAPISASFSRAVLAPAAEPAPTLAPPVAAAGRPSAADPLARLIIHRLRAPRKRRPLHQRRDEDRKPAAKRSAPAMRARLEKAKRTPRALPALPSRKPDYPVVLRQARPRLRRPPLRKRAMRKPAPRAVTQISRGRPKPAAVSSR
ncbi:hypothetical protein [Rhodopseudomonas palustris]|uniref:Uncharacterized protein n=1 Tax=Rhodopseudomonas palustris TaxID=1076 RepID=A0A418UXZ2_RHOPL|nr:hypothetical protein [Rhodopseudomonas palustris]RJF66777.1 hypothetical protein D4Q52_23715 [Rhodopseudomonas palustris]